MKIEFVQKPNGRWLIRYNKIEGKSKDYSQTAFWPTDENPEIVGHTAYYGEEKCWRIHSEIKDIEFKDETLP